MEVPAHVLAQYDQLLANSFKMLDDVVAEIRENMKRDGEFYAAAGLTQILTQLPSGAAKNNMLITALLRLAKNPTTDQEGG